MIEEQNQNVNHPPDSLLSPEQEAVLDLYINNLDSIFEEIKESEKTQVEIETLHLKRILSS